MKLRVNMQNLHHLGVKLGIVPLQVVLNLVVMYLVGAENPGDRSARVTSMSDLPTVSGLRPR